MTPVFGRHLFIILLLTVVSALAATPQPAPPPDVEWMVEGDSFLPSTTLEVRFARAMVSGEQLGLPAAESPLVIAPPVAGKFTWLSTRSGVFTPSEAPKLGTAYQVTLSPKLTDLDHKPIGAGFKAVLKTPAFGLSYSSVGDEEPESLMPNIEVRLAFNREVALQPELFAFVNDAGKSRPAKVRYATAADRFNISADAEAWTQRWQRAQAPEPQADDDEDEEGEPAEPVDSTKPLRNRLLVSPVGLLEPGSPWRLEIRAGLKALEGPDKISKAQRFKLGSVAPFTINSLLTSSYLNSGRSVSIEFSDSLAPDVTEETAPNFFKVTPAVKNLKFEPAYDQLQITGDFELGTNYTLNIDRAMVADTGLPLSGARQRSFKFAPVSPRIYLPEITGHQIASGRREFPLHSVNLKSTRVIARLVDPDKAAAAIAAFEQYNKEFDENAPGESYQALPPGLISGKVIFDHEFAVPDPEIDARQEATLDWTQILDQRTTGTIFLTVEGTPLPGIATTTPPAPAAGSPASAGAAAKPGSAAKVTAKQRPGAQALIQLTDLGVLWKKLGDGIETTTFSMASGKTLKNAKVTLLDSTFHKIGSASTDADGMAKLPNAADPAWLVARLDDDVFALRMGQRANELPASGFQIPISYEAWGPQNAEPAPTRGLIFTDRPLYRPGETVHIKGLLRSLKNDALSIDGGKEGTLVISQPRQRSEKKLTIRIDARGAFDAEFQLDPTVVGRYSIQLTAEGKQRWVAPLHTSFLAADFQPNAFELSLAAPDRFAPDAPVTLNVAGKYLFGSPLGAAQSRWTLQYTTTTFSPEGFQKFSFANNSPAAKSLTLRGDGPLAKDGTTSIQPQLPQPQGQPARGRFTVEVTDLNQQTVSESRAFVRDAADFYIGLQDPESRVLNPKQELAVQAIAVRPDGQPVTEPVAVKLELIRIRNETVRMQGADKALTFRTDRHEDILSTVEKRTLAPTRVDGLWQVASGDSGRFAPDQAGQYLIRATARDSKGRQTVATIDFSVSGKDAVSWDYRNPAQIQIVADKTEYLAGDQARLLVKAPFAGDAWVTVERQSRILRRQRVRLEGNSPTITIPLTAEDSPNVFVSVMLIRGAEQSTRKFKMPEYRYGICQLRVVDPSMQLKVELAPQTALVEPGEDINTTIKVTDSNGAPVRNAEVTFFAVDDGVLALTGYERPQPLGCFDIPFSLAVRTGLSLYELFAEDPADLQYANKGYLIGGGGNEGSGPKLRTDFPGTACWLPSLVTDSKGQVSARFKAPDAITRYRLVAVAHAGTKQFGSNESSVQIRKPFVILSALGQGANNGDQIVARAVVRNDSGADGTAEIMLILDSTAEAVNTPLNAKLELKAGESRAVDFPVRLQAVGDARWQWSGQLAAGGKTHRDALAATLKIGSPVPLLRETYLSELSAATNDLLAGVNPQLLEGSGSAQVTLSNTRLASLRESADALLTYPYGCAEQTVSALIPWIVIGELGDVLPDLTKDPADRTKAIQIGVAKIFAMQTPGGGIGYWPGAREPSFFASAYAALALGQLAKQGVELPGGWPRLLRHLSTELRGLGDKHSRLDLNDAALALLALAEADQAEPAYHEQLYARRAELSFEGRALLACALLQAKDKTALVPALLDPRVAAPERFSWFGSAARERAVRLLAWTRFKPDDREVGRLVKELLASQHNGRWRTTQENAWALLSLSRYFSIVERGLHPVSGELVKAGAQTPFALDKTLLSKTARFSFGPAAPLGQVSVTNPKKANLYGETKFVAYPPVGAQPRQDRGYAASRSYSKIAEDGSLQDATELKVGDRVLVTLRVETPIPGHFVAIDDPLPSILEAVNPEFRTQAVGGVSARNQDWAADYREIRADRVLYFCDHLPTGAHTFRYLARVRTAGKVTAPALKVEEMYRPERFGLSATDQLESRAASR